MTPMEAIEARISCRAYTDEPLDQGSLDELRAYTAELTRGTDLRFVIVGPAEGGARLKLVKRMFAGKVSTYAALIGPDNNITRERVGYLGEKLVLKATQMGLGSCWVAGTFDRKSVSEPLAAGEVLHDVIPLGHAPAKQPFAQRTIRASLRKRDRKPEALFQGPMPLAEAPAWIAAGIDAVIKGPSAVNEQPVVFVWEDERLTATLPYGKRNLEYTDLGIAKLHFEIAAEEAGMAGAWEPGAPAIFVPRD